MKKVKIYIDTATEIGYFDINSHLHECGREKAFWFNSPSLACTSGGIENRTGGLFYYALRASNGRESLLRVL